MIFLQPIALWGLFGLVLLVVIHLFNFQRTEKILFSNTRLLSEVVQKTKKARQIKSWFLLALRMLALSCVILAFAQPRWKGDQNLVVEKGLPQILAYLDNSFSMDISGEGSKPIDLALNSIRSLPNKYGNRGWYQLLTNGFETKHQWTSATGFSDQVTEMAQPTSGRKMPDVLQRAKRQMLGQNLGDARHIYLFSDFQKSGTGLPQAWPLDSQIHYHFNIIEHSPKANVWVDSVWLPSLIQMQEKSQRLRIRLRQSGNSYDKPINLKMIAGGNLISGKTISMNGLPQLEIELPFRIKPGERLETEILVDDQQVTFDNRFFCVLQAPPRIRIFILDDKANPFLRQVYKNQLFQPQFSSLRNPDFEQLKLADFIVVNEPETMDMALSRAIEARVNEGASVFLIPGKSAVVPPWSGLKFEPLAESPGGKNMDWKLKIPEKNSAFLGSTIAELGPNPTLPFSRPLIQLQSGVPLLSYENGDSFLVKITLGKGNFYASAGVFSDQTGNLQKHPVFIPMMFKMAFSANREVDKPLFYRTTSAFGEIISDSIPMQNPDAGYLLENASQKLRINPVRKGNGWIFELPDIGISPGLWKIKVSNTVLSAIAINSSNEESHLEFFQKEELQNIFQGKSWVTIGSIAQDASPEHLAAGTEKGFPLWKFFLCCGLVFFAGEMVWLRFSRK